MRGLRVSPLTSHVSSSAQRRLCPGNRGAGHLQSRGRRLGTEGLTRPARRGAVSVRGSVGAPSSYRIPRCPLDRNPCCSCVRQQILSAFSVQSLAVGPQRWRDAPPAVTEL
jgi:hypothetical protein